MLVLEGGGDQTNARIPPISAIIKPMKKPPKAPAQLTIEKTKIIRPHVTCCWGFERRLYALTMIIIPHNIPRIPANAPMPPMKKVNAAPTAATSRPANKTNIPPIRDKVKAAVG